MNYDSDTNSRDSSRNKIIYFSISLSHYYEGDTYDEMAISIHTKSARHVVLAIYIGIIAGIMSALVKSGFEGIIPPRTPETMPPPEVLLTKLGYNVSTMTYE